MKTELKACYACGELVPEFSHSDQHSPNCPHFKETKTIKAFVVLEIGEYPWQVSVIDIVLTNDDNDGLARAKAAAEQAAGDWAHEPFEWEDYDGRWTYGNDIDGGYTIEIMNCGY